MKSKKCSCIFLLIFFVLCIFSCNFDLVKAQDSYIDKGIKLDVYSRKTWKIKFNDQLDVATISSNTVIVENKSSKKIPVTVTLGDDKKSIIVTPNNQYDYGEMYSLIITDKVTSITGKKLIRSAQMKFKIKDKLKENKDYTVAIDAGHGGYDPGNKSPLGLKEKSINLSVALKVGKILKDNGINVVYTRTSDTVDWNKDNDLKSRLDIVNKSNADYLVSIRCNSYSEKDTVKGIETYYQHWDNISKKFAQNVQEDIINNTKFKDRGIKTATLFHEIVRGTNAHAILVELGFITTADESIIMGSNEFQQNSAKGIANGILKSLNLKDKSKKNSSISNISNIVISVNNGDKYSLPLSVQATMSDGITKDVGVVWDKNYINTSIAGTHTYKGTVAGYSKAVLLTLKVIGSSSTGGSSSSDGSESEDTHYPIVPCDPNTICIDAGHGMGKDTGATGVGGLQEDDVAIKVALKVGKILEDKGVNIIYTRKTDMRSTSMSVKESLQKRCDISNDAKARYFICIHCNSYDGAYANGTETLYCTKSNESKKLAYNIQNNIIKEVETYDRGIKDGNWLYIVKHTNATAILTELGFLTNPSDAAKLVSEEYLDKYAKAISNGILETMGKN